MTKAKPETIEKLRKLMITALHPECDTYEEALERELGFGCKIYYEGLTRKVVWTDGIFVKDNLGEECCPSTIEPHFKIIGLPLTLARIMQALKIKSFFDVDDNYSVHAMDDGEGFGFYMHCYMEGGCDSAKICDWKLTKNGKDLPADDQTEETCQAIIKLLEK